jgi:hypothetical protein
VSDVYPDLFPIPSELFWFLDEFKDVVGVITDYIIIIANTTIN